MDDRVLRMLNKAVTAGTPDEMKKSLNDAIKNTFRNRSSNSNSSVASTPTDEKPVTKTDKSDSNVLGEIVVNGNVLNGDKEKGVGAEKEDKNEEKTNNVPVCHLNSRCGDVDSLRHHMFCKSP